MDSNLVKRIAVAAVGIPVAIGFLWVGGWPLALLVSLIAWLGAQELYALAKAGGVQPLHGTGGALAALIPLLMHAAVGDAAGEAGAAARMILPVGALVAPLVVLALSLRRGPAGKPLAVTSMTLFGVLYTAILPGMLLVIRAARPERGWDGVLLVLFPLAVVWVCDTAAMFGGRAFGRHKLAPAISPGKTREGAIAGVLGGMLMGALMARWIMPADAAVAPASLAMILFVSAAFSVVGQVGDLAESVMKREAGVKDSSNLIPGHGGILDRFDSLYFVLPVALIAYAFMGYL